MLTIIDDSICTKCMSINKRPPCIFQETLKGEDIEVYLSGNDSFVYKKKSVFRCPTKAIQIVDSSIKLNQNCIGCNYCTVSCHYENINTLEKAEYNPSGINKLEEIENILDVHEIKYNTFAVDVKVEGNFRDKRLDAILLMNNKVYIFKLHNKDINSSKYERSISEIIRTIKGKFSKYKFSIVNIMNNQVDVYHLVEKDDYIYFEVSMNNFIKIFKENY